MHASFLRLSHLSVRKERKELQESVCGEQPLVRGTTVNYIGSPAHNSSLGDGHLAPRHRRQVMVKELP